MDLRDTLGKSRSNDGVLLPFKHPLHEELGRASAVIEPLLMLHPFGVLWMLYQTIRHEPKPLPYAALAFCVPFAWVWYYFERVRLRKLTGHA